MATTEGIWTPDDGTDYHPVVDLAAMAASIAARLAATATPTGSTISFAGSTAPTGWLLCQGQAVSRTTYAALFAVIGTTYGAGDGSTTFNLPNLKGRTVVGVDAGQTEFTPLAKTGGEKEHALTQQELPASSVVYSGGTSYYTPLSTGNAANAYVAKMHLNPTQGVAAHNNLQPYIALSFIIKT